ncbi:hypothetical protein L6452_21326 [Arctium lappa]|uniref:Uncharacterized protein n=1 Tax=Arctium lappa TaxID=4217 RepID=A0ACB9BDX7_ARCLA|nr:hypothetical protein L6452_21326 [Arctium lappa]
MDSGHLTATILRFSGMLRLAMSEVVGTPMMISCESTKLAQTPNKLKEGWCKQVMASRFDKMLRNFNCRRD